MLGWAPGPRHHGIVTLIRAFAEVSMGTGACLIDDMCQTPQLWDCDERPPAPVALKCFLCSPHRSEISWDWASSGKSGISAVAGALSCHSLRCLCCSAHPVLISSDLSIWNHTYCPSYTQRHRVHPAGYNGNLLPPRESSHSTHRDQTSAQPASIVCGLCGCSLEEFGKDHMQVCKKMRKRRMPTDLGRLPKFTALGIIR